MPCIAEYCDPEFRHQPPIIELVDALTDELRNAKDKTAFDLTFVNAIATVSKVFGADAVEAFKEVLPVWNGA
jgi:hypothetical protein